ncbi:MULTISPECIES: hypothetical protein [Fictibacillus]|uniref:Uncharacterized protein n=1 Tax=Fictibacillus enclensis TaxID=1017270 RepID=A0A0V8J4S9_9BACL|nr:MULTISPECIES: hypothetical protein [Fictibacillus]KSU81977.1 hypothetical protein AS030_17000 [Fictibacillus enclensis]RXZ01407.1 hypothetical protein DMO16_18130 [Fictibacillus sp. S7]SCC28608.1 hypothetical protein GA0061096_3574 [Fictibacillus enclensis]
MADKHEISMFMKELRRLLHDYKTCNKEFFKKKISDDILLLSSVIYENQIVRYEKRMMKKVKTYEQTKEMGQT